MRPSSRSPEPEPGEYPGPSSPASCAPRCEVALDVCGPEDAGPRSRPRVARELGMGAQLEAVYHNGTHRESWGRPMETLPGNPRHPLGFQQDAVKWEDYAEHAVEDYVQYAVDDDGVIGVRNHR